MFRLNWQRSAGLIALAALIIYIGWIGGPYLRSVILRDAAVTSWINPAPAPIVGYVGPRPLYPGERVGAEGRIAVIEDPLADRSALARAEADAQLVLDLQKTVAGLQSELDRSTQRRSAAEKGTFLLDDGTDAAVASRALEDARLALHQAKLDLALDEVDVQLARNILPAAR